MALTKIGTGAISCSAVTTAKISCSAVTVAKTGLCASTDSVKIPKGSTGQRVSTTAGSLRFNTTTGLLEISDGSIWGRLTASPVFTSVSPTNVLTGDGTGNATIVITGENFDSTATANLITAAGATVNFDTVTRNSSTQITGVIAISSLANANEPYGIKITNGSGGAVTSTGQINIDAQPVFNTASGSLGTFAGGASVSTSVSATDPEAAGAITYSLNSGSLPTGLSLSSSGAITGTATNPNTNTTSSFVIKATDFTGNSSTRSFSILITHTTVYTSFTSSGTFSVPSGITSVDVLVVAGGGGTGGDPYSGGGYYGGGGGAGGLIFRPAFPVTPGGTVTVTVGNGGPTGNVNGQNSVFGTLTAIGGGAGGPATGSGSSGGSGGGGGSQGGRGPGSATQPTQPGDSGTYGFGNPGGGAGTFSAGGGGGAGASGVGGNNTYPTAGYSNGGIGKAYTIADGTTPVYYAGGGAGGGHGGGSTSCCSGGAHHSPGTANRGGGAGAGGPCSPSPDTTGSAGGKGIVIVKY